MTSTAEAYEVLKYKTKSEHVAKNCQYDTVFAVCM